MRHQDMRVGLVGAGYIARWHAEAVAAVQGLQLVAVCDTDLGAAEALAAPYGAKPYADLPTMLAEAALDALHILTPPQLHAAQAIMALQAGVHVLTEKPFALTSAEAVTMQAAAEAAGRLLAVNHNFLGLPSYQRLKALIASGGLGRLDRAEFRWHYPLSPLRSGPFGLWMLRAPGHLLQELGPHLFAFATDLLGPLQDMSLRLSKPISLPGGAVLPQVWTILARAGAVDVTLSLSLVEGGDDRSVSLRGVAGSARLDLAADTLLLDQPNASDLVLNPLRHQLSLARQHLGQGLVNAGRQLFSLNRKQPYALGFDAVLRDFYGAIREGRAVCTGFSAAAGAAVTEAIGQSLALLPPDFGQSDAANADAVPSHAVSAAANRQNTTPLVTNTPDATKAVADSLNAEACGPAAPAAGGIAPETKATAQPAAALALPDRPHTPGPIDALVIGGTGFIGRALTRALVARGYRVRVLSRGRANPFADLGPGVELYPASLKDVAALTAAMRGVATVYHLARAEETTWEAYLKNDVAVTEGIAAAVLAAGVKRLVYTGTIASYDASDPKATITETTDFGPMEGRNLYARSKALCEARLLALHQSEALPVTILRPGIVVGAGGPLQHWGIGRWHGAGALRLWGHGRNVLPFVLVEDVAEGLIRAGLFHDGSGAPEIAGESFNLTGTAMLSARDYFAAIHRLTGTRIRMAFGNLTLKYLSDMLKYRMKRHLLGKQGLARPSKADWLSRGHLSPFANDKARRVLGWQPEADPARFAERAILHPGFFGF